MTHCNQSTCRVATIRFLSQRTQLKGRISLYWPGIALVSVKRIGSGIQTCALFLFRCNSAGASDRKATFFQAIMPRGGSKANEQSSGQKVKGRKSAYSFFVKDERTRWNEQKKRDAEERAGKGESKDESEEKGNDLGAFSTECSKHWKALSEDERAPFHELAKGDKVRYDTEKANSKDKKEEGGGKKRRRATKDPNAPKRAK